MRNMKFVKRIGAVALAVCMVLSCAGCGSSSNKGASEGTTEVTTEGGNSKILVAVHLTKVQQKEQQRLQQKVDRLRFL